MNLQIELTQRFDKAIKAAFPDAMVPAEVTQSRREGFGHYQCNSAMRVGGKPRDAAQAIVEQVDRGDLIADLEIAGPGFINIHLAPKFLSGLVNQMEGDARLGVPIPAKPLRVIVEYSSPNTAKEMHVGHLRSTIIGESLARLLEFLGHDVLRLNHIGDWGTQFGMLIAYMKERNADEAAISDLVTFYKAAKKQFDEDPDFKLRAQKEVVALQGGDPDSRARWERICDISRGAYQEIYDLLGIHLTERGESYYNRYLPEIVADLEKKGLAVDNGGAKCVFLDGFVNRDGEPLPQIVQKSDGAFNYSTTDLAAVRHRVEQEKSDWIIYVVDLGQKIHFEMVFETARRAGYVPAHVRLDHAGFGLVLGPDGKKYKTRSGETEKLIDLLTAAATKARTILAARLPDATEEEAARLGLGAVKYADLSQSRTSDYQFSYDKMLRLEGNTAAFLLYSYVRIASIKRKIGDAPQGPIDLVHPSEIALGLHLAQFSEALQSAADDLLPNRLADYLYTLAGKFNAFFRDCHVQGTPEQASRLALCDLTARTLKTGLNLLGIQTLERM
jgi:arginyl-tRNA synthetase